MPSKVTMTKTPGDRPQREAVVVTPKQQIVNAANQVVEVVDGSGRRLVIKRPGALEKLRLYKCAGSGSSDNLAYLGYALWCLAVQSIDGRPLTMPNTERELEARVAEVGDEGIAAAIAFLAPSRDEDEDDVPPSVAAREKEQTLKN